MGENVNVGPRPGQDGSQVKERTARGTVAHGRTVDVPDPSAVRQVIGVTPEGRQLTRAPVRSFGPGNEIELPAREIAMLRKLGYVVDPDRVLPPVGDGPHFNENAAHASAA